jgi:4-alpha-glucanotransferase
MSVTNTGSPLTNEWGVDLRYEDALGAWHETPDQTIRAVLDSMGINPHQEPTSLESPLLVVKRGERYLLPSAASRIVLESGETISIGRRLPPDLPTGYHVLHLDKGQASKRLIVSPGKCRLPKPAAAWGWSVQLYAARSRESWGIGDFGDLEKLAQWAANQDAAIILLNPLSAATPVLPQQPSPYYPTSRRFFNPLWIRVEWVPGSTSRNTAELESLARAGRELNRDRLINRDAVFRLKMRALELLWQNFQGDDSFAQFCQEHGADLDRFAAFCALAEHHQSGWHSWPQQYRHPDNDEVALFAKENAKRVEFHKWLQWLIDGQLARCSKQMSLMQDLPIGVDPDGADAWSWQDIFAKGMAVGAPPDEFNTQGQNWGLPPFDPHKLRAASYEPFIQTIRAAFRSSGGLRMDHVMGLFRLFWIPNGVSARYGAYVRYNADEMLAIVALESERAGAYVVGEDLGTVEKDVREKLARHRVLSYRLLWFEKEDPSAYPEAALASISTHDLPTVAGLWNGSDLEKQKALNLSPNDESTTEICDRLATVAGLDAETPMDEVIVKAYRVLARAPSRILTATLEDAAAVEERPNMPATTGDQNPNWSMALPVSIEELMSAELPTRIAAALKRIS